MSRPPKPEDAVVWYQERWMSLKALVDLCDHWEKSWRNSDAAYRTAIRENEFRRRTLYAISQMADVVGP